MKANSGLKSLHDHLDYRNNVFLIKTAWHPSFMHLPLRLTRLTRFIFLDSLVSLGIGVSSSNSNLTEVERKN